jgi:hypothetical protein
MGFLLILEPVGEIDLPPMVAAGRRRSLLADDRGTARGSAAAVDAVAGVAVDPAAGDQGRNGAVAAWLHAQRGILLSSPIGSGSPGRVR